MSYPVALSFSERIAKDDDQLRQACDHCGFVDYQNPKIVVGAVAWHEDKVLLCRRAIHPGYGRWTITAGYLEQGETPQQGAIREAAEEANAVLNLGELLSIYTITHLSQVQMIFRATLSDPTIAAGDESLEVNLFSWQDIPWDELAFPSVGWALKHAKQAADGAPALPFIGDDRQIPGSGLSG